MFLNCSTDFPSFFIWSAHFPQSSSSWNRMKILCLSWISFLFTNINKFSNNFFSWKYSLVTCIVILNFLITQNELSKLINLQSARDFLIIHHVLQNIYSCFVLFALCFWFFSYWFLFGLYVGLLYLYFGFLEEAEA